MKLKTLKQHYFEGKLRIVGSIYMSDVVHGQMAIRNKLCKEMIMPSRPSKQDKRHPKTTKGAISKK